MKGDDALTRLILAENVRQARLSEHEIGRGCPMLWREREIEAIVERIKSWGKGGQ